MLTRGRAPRFPRKVEGAVLNPSQGRSHVGGVGGTCTLPPARRAGDWVALAILMAAAAGVFFWNLTASGYANEFYSAAAQAGSQSWSAFLWGASDAGGAITVDKPPASIWLMALSVRVLGLSSFAILLPQAVMGVACTYLCHAVARRYWGNAAGIVAGALFCTTPVTALMFRFNNPDALLVLLMLGAAACVLRGLERDASRAGCRARTRWFALAGALIGLGFLTKQLQVFLVLPGFALAMFAFSPARPARRVTDAAVALGAMVLAAGWWVLLTVIVPSGSRPYIGGSQTDSFLELTFGYNGLGRLTGGETGSVLPGGSGSSAAQGGMWGATGITRLLGSDFAGQFAWLAPFAIAGIVLGALAARARRCRGRMIGDGACHAGRRSDARFAHASEGGARGAAAGADDELARMRLAFIAVFGCWLVVTWLTFSFMAGIFHQYYTVALTPAVAVLAAVCLRALRELRARDWARPVAASLVAVSGLWSFTIIVRSGWVAWLGWAALAACALAALMLLAPAVAELLDAEGRAGGRSADAGACRRAHLAESVARAGAALAVVALMAGPVSWTALTVATGHTGSIVTAGPSSMGGGMGGGPSGGGPGGVSDGAPSDGASGSSVPSGSGPLGGSGSSNSEVAELLTRNASGYRWSAATTGSQNAAGYQLASGLPVMAIGGFNGSDPAPTLEQFKEYVEQGLVRYYIAGGGMGGTQMGGSSAASEIEAWVAETFEAQTVGGATVYDLQPGA